MAFTDGIRIGACLDRNGLRPSRYYITKDDVIIMASEAGVLPIAPERVASKGRLQPGRMFLIDTEQGRIIADEELKKKYTSAQPYREWPRQISCAAGRVAGAGETHRAVTPENFADAAGVRLHVRGFADHRRADGARRRAAAGLDGHGHARSRFCRTSRSCFTITSSSFSRRSPIRRSTRSARRSSRPHPRWSARAAAC